MPTDDCEQKAKYSFNSSPCTAFDAAAVQFEERSYSQMAKHVKKLKLERKEVGKKRRSKNTTPLRNIDPNNIFYSFFSPPSF